MNAIKIWRRVNAALAWPGLLGLALLLGAAGVYVYQVQAQTKRLAVLKQDSASLKLRIEQVAKSGIPETSDQDELGNIDRCLVGVVLPAV